MRAAYHLNAAANDLRQAVDVMLAGTSLSDIDWAILHKIERPSSTITEISRAVARDIDLVGREVLKLEELGLLHVEKKDPPKTSIVTLTTRAERQLPALESAVESVAEQATNGFTNDELEALVSLLERMEKNLG